MRGGWQNLDNFLFIAYILENVKNQKKYINNKKASK
jgi:hypothetical protein